MPVPLGRWGVGYTFAAMDLAHGMRARFQFASDQALLVYFGEQSEITRSKEQPLQKQAQGRAPDAVPDLVGAGGTGAARPLQSQITLQANESVRRLLRLLEQQPVAGVRNLHPAYCSLLIKFDALRTSHDELEKSLREYIKRLDEVKLPEPRHEEIPVCYGGEFGPDLAEVCKLHGMTEAEAIELHTSAEYLVYFLGFVPGFAYLGELPKELATPRLAAPRKQVPAGSVGIAGNQTGVYPFATPGGWRLIGRTPIKMFRADVGGLSLLSIGDRVRFTPISRGRFAELVRR
jgi:KipI family sensor histidine kinase inhibitor